MFCVHSENFTVRKNILATVKCISKFPNLLQDAKDDKQFTFACLLVSTEKHRLQIVQIYNQYVKINH